MIPDRTEIASSFTGAWRLFRMDTDAMRLFNTSMDGFWRSFFAAVLALPSFAVAMTAQFGKMDQAPDPVVAIVLCALAYTASWIVFPVVAAIVVRPMGYGHHYVPYIVARNWAGALVAQVYLATEILILLGIFSGYLGEFVQIILFVITLWYGFMIARIALSATFSLATAMIVLSTALDVLISYLLFVSL